jgi:hypothetical protein
VGDNLVEIRIPKKFSVCIFILISFQALSKVFWRIKIWPPGAFRWIFWHEQIVSDQVQVRFHVDRKSTRLTWNLTCTWSDTICSCQNIHRNAPGGQILIFQNTFDRAWNEIRMKIQTENFFGILISTRLSPTNSYNSLRFATNLSNHSAHINTSLTCLAM